MPGRTPAEAVNDYLEPLSRAISCVTRSVLDVQGGYYPADDPHPMLLAGGDPVRLSTGPGSQEHLAISVLGLYELVRYTGSGGPWEARSVGHQYALEDSGGQEIVAYHWHPTSSITTVPDYPHLHLGAGSGVSQRQLRKAHVPTGYVSLADFLQLLISDFQITPLRRDWKDALEGASGL